MFKVGSPELAFVFLSLELGEFHIKRPGLAIQREIRVIGSIPAFLLDSLDERCLSFFGDFPAILVGELLRLILWSDKTVDGKVAGSVLGEDGFPIFLACLLEMHSGAAELIFRRIEVLAAFRALADDDRVSVA